jgi:hypothetical protein
MSLDNSLNILNISKNELLELDEEKLKKIYKKKALQYHPDKGGNNEEFIKLKNAYTNVDTLLKEKNNILKNGVNGIENYINIDLLKSYANVFVDAMNKFKLNGKYNTKSVTKSVVLNPTIEDILSNNVFKLSYENNTYFVPLWHEEVYFDMNDCELLVKCNAILPNNIYIDVNRNIHIKLDIKYSNIIGSKEYEFTITDNFKYNINIESLYIKDYQIYIIKNVGISKINSNNIYDIDNKTDIICHIYLS